MMLSAEKTPNPFWEAFITMSVILFGSFILVGGLKILVEAFLSASLLQLIFYLFVSAAFFLGAS